jgi:hypothetical protein
VFLPALTKEKKGRQPVWKADAATVRQVVPPVLGKMHTSSQRAGKMQKSSFKT